MLDNDFMVFMPNLFYGFQYFICDSLSDRYHLRGLGPFVINFVSKLRREKNDNNKMFDSEIRVQSTKYIHILIQFI